MRNVFDQYDQRENKLSHALACSLHEDSSLCAAFIEWVCGKSTSGDRVAVECQHPPGEACDERPATLGNPDIWIVHKSGRGTDSAWALVIECKVGSGVSTKQLYAHRQTARYRGFDRAQFLLLTASEARTAPKWVKRLRWQDVYCWLRKRTSSHPWAARLAGYLEVAERRFSQEGDLKSGTLTEFDGFYFDDSRPYSEAAARRMLKLAMPKLKAHKLLRPLGIDPESGRSKISGAWDFIGFIAAKGHEFTEFPHLTIGIGPDSLGVSLTVPHKVRVATRKRLLGNDYVCFRQTIAVAADALRKSLPWTPGVKATIYIEQRHFVGQTIAIQDARLQFDLETVFPRRHSGVKPQPEWLQVVYDVLRNKRSNLQLGIEARLPYTLPKLADGRKAIDLVASTFAAFDPFLRRILSD